MDEPRYSLASNHIKAALQCNKYLSAGQLRAKLLIFAIPVEACYWRHQQVEPAELRCVGAPFIINVTMLTYKSYYHMHTEKNHIAMLPRLFLSSSSIN
jgi:hypothetical protein